MYNVLLYLEYHAASLTTSNYVCINYELSLVAELLSFVEHSKSNICDSNQVLDYSSSIFRY